MNEKFPSTSTGDQREDLYAAQHPSEGIKPGIGGDAEVGAEAHSEDPAERIAEYRNILAKATEGKIVGDLYILHRLLRNVSEDTKLASIENERKELAAEISGKISGAGNSVRNFYDK